MSVLITGGCGLIGSTLARLLVNQGEDVTVFDRFLMPARFSGIEDRVRMIRGDLASFSHVLEAVSRARPAVIYHLGAMLSIPANDDPPAAFSVNAGGIFHVLEAARLLEVQRVRFTSTVATFGLDLTGQVIGDQTIQRPTTLYGTTKLFGELLGRFYGTRYGLDFRAVRFPSVVGPGGLSPHVSIYNSWAIEKAVHGEPYQIFVEPGIRCPILYFKDAARSLLALDAAPKESARTLCYTLAGIDPIPSAGELADAIRKAIPGAAITFAPDAFAMDFHRKFQGFAFDDSRARAELGWRTEYSLERMIPDFAEECRSHPERYAGAAS